MKTLLPVHHDHETQEAKRPVLRRGPPAARRWALGTVLVFTLAGAGPAALARDTNETERPPEPVKKRVFSFEGGSPLDFIAALDRHFRTRLVQILTLPETLSRARVPKFRVAADDPREVLTLYNRLQTPTLGQWRFEPDLAQKAVDTNSNANSNTNMNVLMLVPDKTALAPRDTQVAATKVKALPLAGVPENLWPQLLSGIDEAKSIGEQVAEEKARAGGVPWRDLSGRVHLQRESKILVVVGSDAYVEMVESFLSAHRMNAAIQAATPGLPASPTK